MIGYGLKTELITEYDRTFVANALFDALKIEPDSNFDADNIKSEDAAELEDILKVLLDNAVTNGVIDDGIASRDLMDTKLMSVLVPRPGETIDKFFKLHDSDAKSATD